MVISHSVLAMDSIHMGGLLAVAINACPLPWEDLLYIKHERSFYIMIDISLGAVKHVWQTLQGTTTADYNRA